jgi:hypothetical protein
MTRTELALQFHNENWIAPMAEMIGHLNLTQLIAVWEILKTHPELVDWAYQRKNGTGNTFPPVCIYPRDITVPFKGGFSE